MNINRVSAIKEKLTQTRQNHVLQHFSQLTEAEQENLLNQLEAINWTWVEERHQQYRQQSTQKKSEVILAPAPIITIPKTEAEILARKEAGKAGKEALKNGRCAAFLVAGGQGTRLGFPGPKGCFPVGPVSQRSLFQIHAEQILAWARRYQTSIPWYIMTSSVNDAATRDFFSRHSYFGFAKEEIMFFQQQMVPALDFNGKLILESKDSLAMNPNGHGGSLAGLVNSGAIKDMQNRGCDLISYFQVDNPLITICDPEFIGYHLQAKAEMSAKVLAKNTPEERVGIICYQNGKPGVIEYSDLDQKNMYARDKEEKLIYWAGSIAIHILNTDFVAKVGTGLLPWHIAVKKIACLNNNLQKVVPDQENGLKFETFIFDALPLAKVSVFLEVKREEEFAPLKNSQGVDSIDSCRQLLSDYTAKQLEVAGVQVKRDEKGRCQCKIERSYLFALDQDEFALKIDKSTKVDKELVLE